LAELGVVGRIDAEHLGDNRDRQWSGEVLNEVISSPARPLATKSSTNTVAMRRIVASIPAITFGANAWSITRRSSSWRGGSIKMSMGLSPMKPSRVIPCPEQNERQSLRHA
jgi:hypothetical protein